MKELYLTGCEFCVNYMVKMSNLSDISSEAEPFESSDSDPEFVTEEISSESSQSEQVCF